MQGIAVCISALECAVTPLDNRARLEVLHKFFRISEEGRFNFDFDNCAKLGQDFRDSIAPDCIRFCKKHIEIEDFCAKCMTISEYPQQLDDKFISALLQQVPYIVLSIDIEPVETEDAFKEIDNAQMKTDAEKSVSIRNPWKIWTLHLPCRSGRRSRTASLPTSAKK